MSETTFEILKKTKKCRKVLHISKKSSTFAASKVKKQRYMEDVVLKMPTADVALIMQFASRMGWTVENRSNPVARFIEVCSKNKPSELTDEEIQAEVNAVRYSK